MLDSVCVFFNITKKVESNWKYAYMANVWFIGIKI